MRIEIHVIDPTTGETAKVVFAEALHESLVLQMARFMECGGLEKFARWLSDALGAALPTAVDYDLRPPSEAQLKFALDMARTLGVALAPDVLKFRGAMHDFLASHKEALDQRRSGPSPSAFRSRQDPMRDKRS